MKRESGLPGKGVERGKVAVCVFEGMGVGKIQAEARKVITKGGAESLEKSQSTGISDLRPMGAYVRDKKRGEKLGDRVTGLQKS